MRRGVGPPGPVDGRLDRLTLVLTLGGGLGLFLTGLAALARDPAATPVAAGGQERNTRPAD